MPFVKHESKEKFVFMSSNSVYVLIFVSRENEVNGQANEEKKDKKKHSKKKRKTKTELMNVDGSASTNVPADSEQRWVNSIRWYMYPNMVQRAL